MDTEMDHYIPNFKDKWLEKKENGKFVVASHVRVGNI